MYFMLHIGKTGGTYTKHILSSIPDAENLFRFLYHQFTLEMALNEFPNENAIFSIRDPLEIFVSGFYSRMRKGQPRYNYPWTPAETITFSTFKTPNQLAEALSSDERELRELAESSMRGLQHVAQCLHFYLRSKSFVQQCKPRISFVFQQHSLDEDIKRFLAKNNLPTVYSPITDNVIRHSNPVDLDRALSPTANQNLAFWYKTDFELYDECRSLASEINSS